MKTLYCFIVLALCIFNVLGQVPPSVLPTSAFINYGASVSLTASGCAGTVTWSTGQTGVSINVSPRQSARFTATCTSGMVVSGPSNLSLIHISQGIVR